MRSPLAVRWHLALLALFCVAMTGIWMAPVLLAGFPYQVPPLIPAARYFAETGVLLSGQMHFVTMVYAALHTFLDWRNLIGWTFLSTGIFAVALIPLWWSVYKLFDARIAWITTAVTSFMPVYWSEITRSAGYPFAFLFLFAGFAFFVTLYPRRRIAAMVAFGLCFGATIASHHTFLEFPFWLIIVYLWDQRNTWKRALLEIFIAGACAGIVFVLPQFPNALRKGMTFPQRLAVFIPSAADHLPGATHLYPDGYAATVLRKDFDAILEQRAAEGGFLEQRENENLRVIFGSGRMSIFRSLFNGAWLFLNALPQLFLDETVGGVFLWLFTLPGIIVLYARRRRLLAYFLGLWLSMEVLLRFVLHYSRVHVMDVGWMIALFAAVGMVAIAQILHAHARKFSVSALVAFVLVVTSAQLVQANRKLFARLYAKSTVPESFAAADALAKIPPDAVVADSRKDYLFAFSDRKHVTLHPETLDLLASRGKLRDPFLSYHVTHIIGYAPEETALILKEVPSIQAVTFDAGKTPVPLTPLIKYLLNLVR